MEVEVICQSDLGDPLKWYYCQVDYGGNAKADTTQKSPIADWPKIRHGILLICIHRKKKYICLKIKKETSFHINTWRIAINYIVLSAGSVRCVTNYELLLCKSYSGISRNVLPAYMSFNGKISAAGGTFCFCNFPSTCRRWYRICVNV